MNKYNNGKRYIILMFFCLLVFLFTLRFSFFMACIVTRMGRIVIRMGSLARTLVRLIQYGSKSVRSKVVSIETKSQFNRTQESVRSKSK